MPAYFWKNLFHVQVILYFSQNGKEGCLVFGCFPFLLFIGWNGKWLSKIFLNKFFDKLEILQHFVFDFPPLNEVDSNIFIEFHVHFLNFCDDFINSDKLAFSVALLQTIILNIGIKWNDSIFCSCASLHLLDVFYIGQVQFQRIFSKYLPVFVQFLILYLYLSFFVCYICCFVRPLLQIRFE